ncbi:MAG: hypothetical protein K9J81_09175 [Desulfohalobiaceae bacterium]|nr:hypothetical protein [Desulfohalobiaceae bacterium]
MMQGSGGRGTGSGMKDRGWSRDRSGSYGGQQPAKPLQKDTARDLAQNYAAGNPNLKAGQVTEQDHVFAATIVTRDGSLVEKLEIDKNTGWMRKGY